MLGLRLTRMGLLGGALLLVLGCPRQWSPMTMHGVRPRPTPCATASALLTGGNPPNELVVEADNPGRERCRVSLTNLELSYAPEWGVEAVVVPRPNRITLDLEPGRRIRQRFAVRWPAPLPSCGAKLAAKLETLRGGADRFSAPLGIDVACGRLAAEIVE